VYDWSLQLTCSSGPHSDISAGALIPVGPHRGKVLFWRQGCGSAPQTVSSYLFDPARPGDLITITHPGITSDLFCAGFSWDSQGQLVVAGGAPTNSTAPCTPSTPGFTCGTETYLFSPGALSGSVLESVSSGQRIVQGSNAWQRVDDMNDSRYYPSLCPLNRRPFGTGGATYLGGGHLVVGGSPNPYPPLPATAPCTFAPTTYLSDATERWQQIVSQRPPPATTFWDARVLYPDGAGAVPAAPASPVPFDRYDILGNLVPTYTTQPTPKLETYPRMFQLADLRVDQRQHIFVANDLPAFANVLPLRNPDGMAWTIKPPYGTQTNWQIHQAPFGLERFYGTAVMLHTRLIKNRIVVFGGARNTVPSTPYQPNWQIVQEVQEFVIPSFGTTSQGQWITKTNGLAFARMQANAVILPTGQVLIVGGGSDVGICDAGAGTPSFQPEIYNIGLPTSLGASTALMSATQPVGPGLGRVPRLYHSMATLLEDGRVLLAGGENYASPPFELSGKNGEVFSPPYMTPSSGSRPTIGSAASSVGFSTDSTSSTFVMTVTHSHPLDRVVLLRPSAVTHAFDIDQRYIELEFTDGGSTSGISRHRVTAPTEDLGPPGWYMLFVVQDLGNGERIPSNAWWIQIT